MTARTSSSTSLVVDDLHPLSQLDRKHRTLL
jgi:hypothetical protein